MNDEPEDMPDEFVIADGDPEMEAHMEEHKDPTDPWGAAMLFWLALKDPAANDVVLRALSTNPSAWGDGWSTAVEMIESRSIAGDARYPDFEGPEPVAYVLFVPDLGYSVQAFGEVSLRDYVAATLLRDPESGWWRVWGLSHDYLPTADDIWPA